MWPGPCKTEMSKLFQMTNTMVRNAVPGKSIQKQLSGLYAQSGLAECAARHCKVQKERLAEFEKRNAGS